MTLKSQTDKTPVPVAAPPAWGDLAEPSEPVGVIRFECEDGSYSYPYHALLRWVLHAGNPECLVVQAGNDQVTVRGHVLNVVRDALEAGRLRVLRTVQARYGVVHHGTIVVQIEVEKSKQEERCPSE